jgi:flagellar basal-body rod protein FlgF
MDHLIYTSMSGAKHTLQRQDTLANNLANANTPGFRADSVAFRSVPLRGAGAGTRATVIETTPGADMSAGPMMRTGRDLDVAVQGPGFIAVLGGDGNEAYTRNGALEINAEGTLQLANGAAVLSDGGPITVPQDAAVEIGSDGTVSAKTSGSALFNSVGRIKLVNPDTVPMAKGPDGLFRTRSGETLERDPNLRVAGGTLEASNVNPVEAMIAMIAAARQFEMQMKLLQAAEQNDQKANQLLGAS